MSDPTALDPVALDPVALDPVALDPVALRKLARVIRAVFPHDGIPDAPYLRSAEALRDQAAATSPRRAAVVAEGLRSLQQLTGGDVEAIDVDALSGILRHLEQTEFFQAVLTSSVVSFYSDPEVWQHLGYEGPSFEKGGYVNRGFDDLDWLPEPRIEEYAGDDEFVEYVPPVPGLQVSFDTTKKVAQI